MRVRLYPPQKIISGGNHTTAARWVHILHSLGNDASLEDFDSRPLQAGELGIFINGAKSAQRILTVDAMPERKLVKIVVVLSGTDLQEEMLVRPKTQAALQVADALVVYERSAMSKLTSAQLQKTVLVPHSAITLDLPNYEFPTGLNIVSVSHIRPQKNLLAYFRCLKKFSKRPGLKFHHIGGTIDAAHAEEVGRIAAGNENIVLHGKKTFETTVAMIRAADLMIHPSLVEGFPNVLVEAIVNRTPIAISRIPVHTATFSDCLPDQLFFATDCGDELRQLVDRFITNEALRCRLQQACIAIAERFKPEVEAAGLLELLHAVN